MDHSGPASEQDFLALIDRHFPGSSAHSSLPRGDDCAVLACPPTMVLSTDLFLEDIHFRRSYFSPGDIGWKALAVNVSDIAAMGARPLGFSLGLMIPAGPPPGPGFWGELLAGMAALAREHDLTLTGGDLSRAPLLGLCVTIWGRPGPTGRLLTRGACRPGDVLLACGHLGLVRAGLQALEAEGPAAARRWPAAAAAHLRPRPQVAAGLALAAHPGVRAAMDVSDGLAQDLPRLLGQDRDSAPGAAPGAALTLTPEALHPETRAWCEHTGQDSVTFACLGGEDYALLAACDPHDAPAVLAATPGARAIGTVTAAPGITLNGQPAPARGFDHFSTT